VFRNSKPWLAIVPLAKPESKAGIDLDGDRELTAEEKKTLSWTNESGSILLNVIFAHSCVSTII